MARADVPDENTTDFVIPEDLTGLTDEQLGELREQAATAFDGLYGDGTALTDEAVDALATLTEGIETIHAELDVRSQAATERAERAAALAARVRPAEPEAVEEPAVEVEVEDESAPVGDPTPDVEADQPAAPTAGDQPLPVAAAAAPRREYRVNLEGLTSRQSARRAPARAPHEAQGIKDVMVASGDGTGYAPGTGIDWLDVGRIVDKRLGGFNPGQYEAASRAGQHISQQHGVAALQIPFTPDLIVASADPEHVSSVLKHAVDESRLPGKSLVASGGWCAPSETLYDLCEMESRDGLLSLPTIQVSRGGISWTPGPDFAAIWTAGVGFHYTEAEDIAGAYVDGTPNTVGSKPCYKVPCPTFTEARLETDGLCITAGLLQQRGYPEVISRTVRGALVAHDHLVSQNQILGLVSGSTAVTATAATAGTLAPLLKNIELQVEHYRYSQRLARGTTLEAIFPYWIRGAIRADLALRAGGDASFITVSDAQINSWFASRGVNAQFVYDWQALTGAAGAQLNYPATVAFLLYAAGTWVLGTQDVITVDTLYDSVLLGTNDFVALFTESAYLLAKLCHDSRVVTVPVCTDGATSAAIALECTGVASVAG